MSGGAYGFYTSVGVFGGPAGVNGPKPEVTLAGASSASPVTASEPNAIAQYGPAKIFSSDKLEVSTQGTAGSVTSSATVENVGVSGLEAFAADRAFSTCTANDSGVSGSTKISGGKLRTSLGADFDFPTDDDTVVDIPADPAPNTSFEGQIENVGDKFRFVVNEQIMEGDGSITVNAGHLYLLGALAVGDAIFGQTRCSTAAPATAGGG